MIFAIIHPPITTNTGQKFRIDAPALEVSFVHRYPENRLAKLLHMNGYTGRVECFDKITGNPRISFDIEKYSRRCMTETDVKGICWTSWVEKNLVWLRKQHCLGLVITQDSRKVPPKGSTTRKPAAAADDRKRAAKK